MLIVFRQFYAIIDVYSNGAPGQDFKRKRLIIHVQAHIPRNRCHRRPASVSPAVRHIPQRKLSSPAFHAKTIQVLDEQKQEALTLSVAITAASTALSFMPDDAASPIANELADLSLPLFLIVAIVYLETFLLTTFGWIASVFLIPAACLLAIGFILCRKRFLLAWMKKALVLALTLLLLIPASAAITTQIKDTFSETVNQKLHAASHITNAAESEEKEDTNAFFSFFSSLANNVSAMADAARNMLSTLVDAVAVLLITSCVIPILTLLVFLQIMKLALNVDIPVEKLELLIPSAHDRHGEHTITQKSALD